MDLTCKPAALLSLIGVMLLWPHVLTKSVSYSASLSAGQGEGRPHVVKRSTQNCDSSYDKYCLNDGQCMLLVDINEHHCKCERGFYGPRCSNPELVVQPMGEEQIIVAIFCVSLLIIGLSGALYFCCKWSAEHSVLQDYEGDSDTSSHHVKLAGVARFTNEAPQDVKSASTSCFMQSHVQPQTMIKIS